MRLAWLTSAIAIAAIGFAVNAERRAATRLARDAAELAAVRQERERLSDALHACRVGAVARSPAGPGGASAPAAACPDPPPCAAPPALPSGARSDASVRDALSARIEQSIPAEEMDDATRVQALDLLMEVRALRSQQVGRGLDDATAPELRDAFHAAQQELIALTGMGVAEFLHRLRRPDPEVSRLPEEAGAPAEGELRKRFADELAVALGIAEPGSVEVLQDGEWTAE